MDAQPLFLRHCDGANKEVDFLDFIYIYIFFNQLQISLKNLLDSWRGKEVLDLAAGKEWQLTDMVTKKQERVLRIL